MVKAPTKLNGFPVIASMTHSNGYVSVMVERDDEFMPFVVATWHEGLKNSWTWGHYFYTRDEAVADFQETQARNQNRGNL